MLYFIADKKMSILQSDSQTNTADKLPRSYFNMKGTFWFVACHTVRIFISHATKFGLNPQFLLLAKMKYKILQGVVDTLG